MAMHLDPSNVQWRRRLWRLDAPFGVDVIITNTL